MLLLKIWWHVVAAWKKLFYKMLFGRSVIFGKSVTFRSGFKLLVDRNAQIEIGDNVFFNNYCSLNCLGSIKIGNGTIFGENVRIYDHNHRFNNIDKCIKEQGFSVGTVQIGEHCWIGSNVVVLKGAKIGNHCVIGAGAVISKDIPSGTLVKCSNSYTVEKIDF